MLFWNKEETVDFVNSNVVKGKKKQKSTTSKYLLPIMLNKWRNIRSSLTFIIEEIFMENKKKKSDYESTNQ